MQKRIAVVILGVLIVAGLVIAMNFKSWALAEVKKQLRKALQTQAVVIQDMSLPLHGPIVLSGVEIKKGSAIELKVTKLTLDRGIWSMFGGSNGTIDVQSFKADNFKLRDVHVSFWWKEKDLIIHVLNGRILNGNIQGDIIIQLQKLPAYQSRLTLGSISLPQFITDYKLKDKLSLTGVVQGQIQINGQGKEFTFINGNLGSLGKGGELIIKDTDYLEKMAKQSGQSMDLIVASLKHYPYNTGNVAMALEGDNLKVDFNMEGDTGKRNLTVIIHQFSLERLGL